MKVGIVGMGGVGAATAMALLGRARISELMLVNRNRARAKGVATDMRYGAPLSGPITIKDGDYADLAGAAAVIVTAVSMKRQAERPIEATLPAYCACSAPIARSTRRSYRLSWRLRLRP